MGTYAIVWFVQSKAKCRSNKIQYWLLKMNESPLVSVVMSAFNSENYLVESIESILNQTFSDFEFIIIDDGSTDETLSIINRFAIKDPRIKVISRENKGLPYSLNEGIRKARGKYIARMDADDVSLPFRLEEQVRVMESNAEIIVCGSWVKKIYNKSKAKISKYPEHDAQAKARLIIFSCFAHPSVIIRKSVFVKHNIWYDEKFLNAQDYMLWTKMAKLGLFYNIPKVLLNYRVVEDGISKKTEKQKETRTHLFLEIYASALALINLKQDEREVILRLAISHKDRLSKQKISQKELKIFFDKILEKNNNCNFSDDFTLRKTLGNRWLLSAIVNKNAKAIFSKYFWYGVIGLVN